MSKEDLEEIPGIIQEDKPDDKPQPTPEDIDKLLGIPVENAEDKDKGHNPVPDDARPIHDVLDGLGDPNNFFDSDGNPNKDAMKDSGMDSDLVAEFGIEIMDLALGFGARAISGDWEEDFSGKKYEISDRKKAQLRKPLQKILERKGAKVSPELLFGIMVIALYFPMYYNAYKERKRNQEKQKPKPKAKPVQQKAEPPKRVPRADEFATMTKEEAGIPEPGVKWLRKHEAAKLAGVSQKTIVNWGADGKLVRSLVKKNKVSEWYYSEESVKAQALKSRMRPDGKGARPKAPISKEALK